MVECYGDDWRDLPFTEDAVPEYGASDYPPSATFLMRCEADKDDIYDEEEGPLAGLLHWWDTMFSMGGSVDASNVDEVAARLRGQGHEVVAWSAVAPDNEGPSQAKDQS